MRAFVSVLSCVLSVVMIPAVLAENSAVPMVDRLEVYKCLRGKDVVYQDDPCPATHRTDRVDTFLAPANARRAAQERRRIQREMDRRNAAQRASGAPALTWRRYDQVDCKNARARRLRHLQQIGTLRISPDQHHELCQPVVAACGYCE